MTLLILEALGALLIFVLIIWWTMFHGRKNGEPPSRSEDRLPPEGAAPARERPSAGAGERKAEDQ
jgi:hypothetical protein